MATPLRSENPAPEDRQFTHFGVLNDGTQSKGAFTTALVTNLVIAALAILVTSAVHTVVKTEHPKDIAFVQPVKEPPPAPKPPPPPPPKLPPTPKLAPPKITPPPEKLPDVKPIEVHMAPQPIHMAPAPPRAVTPPPAPKPVDLHANFAAAAVRNNDAHPSPVRMGSTSNPLKPLTGPAVSRVDLGVNGHPGMSASNTGNGPRSASTVSGFGCPNCTDLNGRDRGSAKVVGVKITAGGNGPLNSRNLRGEPVNVHLQTQAPPPPPPQQTLRTASAASPPKLVYKPRPVYTEEAKQMRLEGAVSIRIRVAANGAVSVLGVAHGLGHGLDEAALQAARGMRFSPALDSSGHPVNWEGVVNVNFQMAG